MQDLQLVHPWLLLRKEGTRRQEIEPERVDEEDDDAIDGGRGPGGAAGGDVTLRWAVVAAAVEVELGAGEEEAAGEEVDGQRVDREDREEHQRPAKAPRPAAVARRRRHHLRFGSVSSQPTGLDRRLDS